MERLLHCRRKGKFGRLAGKEISQRSNIGRKLHLVAIHRARDGERSRLTDAGDGEAEIDAARYRLDGSSDVPGNLAIGNHDIVDRKSFKVAGDELEDIIALARGWRWFHGWLDRDGGVAKNNARASQLNTGDPDLTGEERHWLDRGNRACGRHRHSTISRRIGKVFDDDTKIGDYREMDRAIERYFSP
ncbi:MAG TPA: hypothetical protein VL147_23365 [Devosia sp.]|nr:hypothetical protein [Devosia sp.]